MIKITNTLTEEYLKIDVKNASTFLKKLKGLMFEKEANFNYALVFDMGREAKARNSIHMLFVFFPITALFLNSSNVVVDKAILNPFKLMYTPKERCKYIIEIPNAYNNKIKIGDKITWK